MRAVRLTAPQALEVTTVPEPEGDTIVRSETMGICGTDIKVLHGAIPVEMPRILGHELVGRVVRSSDPRLAPGTRVLADPALACGTCASCVRGRPNLCRRGGLMGREVEGVFAEFIAVEPHRLLVVPYELGDEAGGLLQVLGTAVHALSAVDLQPDEVALVIGLGVAGQLMARLLASHGLRVVGVTRSQHKRDLAARHGAEVASPADAPAILDEVTGGDGPAVVVEAVGTEATLATAIELAGPGADVVAFGTSTNGGRGLPYYQLYFKELTLWNPRAALLADYARAIELVAGGMVIVDDIVSHSVPLEEAPRAFELAENPASLKVLITNLPGGESR